MDKPIRRKPVHANLFGISEQLKGVGEMVINEKAKVPFGWSWLGSRSFGVFGFDFGIAFGRKIFVIRTSFLYWTIEIRYKGKEVTP